MTRNRKLISMLAAIILCMSMLLAACTNTPTNETTDSLAVTDAPTSAPTDAPTDVPSDTSDNGEGNNDGYSYDRVAIDLAQNAEKLNVFGRSPVTSEGIVSGWSASGFELYARCKKYIAVSASVTQECRYALFVDGVKKETFIMTPDKDSYRLTTNMEEGEHEIRIVKESNVEQGRAIFSKLYIYGELLDAKTATKDRLFVEFVGDSITCGYGLGGTTSDYSHFDATAAYSYLLADKIDANHSMVSISGIGLSKSTNRHNGNTIGSYYDYVNYSANKTDKYAPTQKADIVVINLGTNDNNNSATESEYKTAARALIEKIRATHGNDVKIVWVKAMMISESSSVNTWTDAVLSELGGSANGFYSVTVPTNTSGYGAHPNAAANVTAANTIYEYMKSMELVK